MGAKLSCHSIPSPPPPTTLHHTYTTADADGLVKLLSDAKTDRILGVHIIGSVSILISACTPHPHIPSTSAPCTSHVHTLIIPTPTLSLPPHPHRRQVSSSMRQY